MIYVKYSPGASGNFICTVLASLKENHSKLEYGNPQKILHLWEGSFDKNILSKAVYDFDIINCNMDTDNQISENFYKDFKVVFVRVNDSFIEYRLNNIYKCPPQYMEQSNKEAHIRFKNSNVPVASDEAERMRRLKRGLEQNHVIYDDRDIVFDFGNLYREKEIWINSFKKLFSSLSLEYIDFEFWHNDFINSQKLIIEKADKIKKCVENKSFDNELTENEKGIVIGEFCNQQGIDEYSDTFDQLYKQFS